MLRAYIDAVRQMNPTAYPLAHCLSFVSSECLRLLLTQSMYNAQMLLRCGERM